jgi:hypothetical protein
MRKIKVRMAVSQGVCGCGHEGKLQALLVEELPVTMPGCPVCQRRDVENALKRLTYQPRELYKQKRRKRHVEQT